MANNNYCVYIHKNKINNKVYVGQTCHLNIRWKPKSYIQSPKFYNAIQKYGWNEFQHIVIKDKMTLEQANKLEIELIKKYDSINNGYNIQPGGSGIKPSNISKAKEVKCLQTGKVFYSSIEASSMMNLSDSEIRKVCRGEQATVHGFHFEYTKEQKKSNGKHFCVRDKKIRCIETQMIFNSAKEAGDWCGSTSPCNIGRCCRGERKTHKGYHWEYVKEDWRNE